MNTATTSDLSQTETTLTRSACDEAALVALAGDPSISDEEQERLAAIGSPAVREALAANPCLNEIQQGYLAETGSMTVKCELAKNPSLIDALQQTFADGNISEIREALAKNPKLASACQPLLMQDKDSLSNRLIYTLIPLASNPALTEEMQNKLAHSVNIHVVAGLAKNPSIPESLMVSLSNCNLREISIGLASNPKLPEHLQAELITSGDAEVLENIARNPSLKIAQQVLLAHEGSVDVRLALLENTRLDAPIKARVSSSFTRNDLNRAERSREDAESKSMRLHNEHMQALEKCIKAHGGFFPSSDEKIEHLNNAAEHIQKRISEIDSESYKLSVKIRQLKELTQNQPESENRANIWPFPIIR